MVWDTELVAEQGSAGRNVHGVNMRLSRRTTKRQEKRLSPMNIPFSAASSQADK